MGYRKIDRPNMSWIREQMEAGRSDADLASELNVNGKTIWRWRQKIGLKRNPPYNPEKIIELYSKQKKSIPEVSKELSVPLSTIRFFLFRNKLIRSKTEGIHLAIPRMSAAHKGKKVFMTPEWRANIKNARVRWGEMNAVGFSLKPSGYIALTRGENKGRHEHVVIMESIIGRKLYQHEVVHHIDENRSNNSIENLQLMTRSNHTSYHRNKKLYGTT